MLPLRACVDQEALKMKGYSAFPKALSLQEPHHQIVLCRIQDAHCRGLTPLQRGSRCILQLQPTGQSRQQSKSTDTFILLYTMLSCEHVFIRIQILELEL